MALGVWGIYVCLEISSERKGISETCGRQGVRTVGSRPGQEDPRLNFGTRDAWNAMVPGIVRMENGGQQLVGRREIGLVCNVCGDQQLVVRISGPEPGLKYVRAGVSSCVNFGNMICDDKGE